MKRINPERALTSAEKTRRLEAKYNVKNFTMTFRLTDPDELAVYEFLSQYKSRRRVIITALKNYMQTIDKQ